MSRSPTSYAKPELDKDVDPESLQRWVVSFCIIRFDLEQGQLIEECYPTGVLSNEEELDVAFSSFPDSVSQNQNQNRSSIHDSMFFFRTRRRKRSQQRNVTSSEITDIDDKEAFSESAEKMARRTKAVTEGRNFQYLYGYVFNRQRHDERLKRGGEQKSVVILSHCPYSNVFRPLLQIMGPLYFDIGMKALEHIATYVSLWPAPLPGKLMELPIGNAKLKVYLPPANSLPVEHWINEDSASFMAPIPPNNQSIPQGIFHDSDIFGVFRGILLQLWLLWELLLIGEPILIIGPTPPQCSEAVASLISLVAPLPCSVDFRPYFTIHDPEFAHLNSLQEGDAFPAMVLGVTNLFFLKALRKIPHVVSVGSPAPVSNSSPVVNRASFGRVPGRPDGLGLQQLSLRRFSPSNILNAVKLRRDGPLCLMSEHKEAVWSTYAATTKPDTSILNRLIDVGMSPRIEESMSVVNNEILRRHFLELTTNFLAPFGPYFRTTVPSEGSSPFADPPPLPPFIAEEFLESLSSRGVGKFLSKRMRPNWLDLYKRFLKGPNFMPWFQSRRIVAEQEQHRLWRQARLKADVHKFLSNMSELEVVDSFNVIERHLYEEIQLQNSGRALADSAAICHKLKKDLQEVFNVLPKDMQKLMLMNPERASHLRGCPEPIKLPGRPSLQIGVVSASSPR